MVDKEYTHVRLRRDTVKMLKETGKKKETYDDIIRRLIDEVSKDD